MRRTANISTQYKITARINTTVKNARPFIFNDIYSVRIFGKYARKQLFSKQKKGRYSEAKKLEPVFIRNVCGFSSIILLQSRQKSAGGLSPGKGA